MASNQIKIVISADDKASKPLRQVANEVDNTSKKTSMFGDLLSRGYKIAVGSAIAGGIALTGTLTAAANASFDQVKAVEEARYGLLAYEKDSRKVNQVLGDLVTYAKSDMGVLFNRKDMFAAASTLKMYGNETETLTDRVKILSKGVSQGKTTFQELSQIVGRAAAKGRLDAVDFDMLIERGIGLDRRFRGAKVSAKELWAELNRALPDKLLEGRANTIEGRMIRLQSAFRGVGDALLGVDSKTNNFIEGGLGDRMVRGLDDTAKFLRALAPVVRDVTNWLLRLSDAIGSGIAQGLQWTADAAKNVAQWFGDVARVVSGGLTSGFKGFLAVADAVGKWFQDAGSWVKERFNNAVDGARTVVGWFRDRLDDVNKGLDAFHGWIVKNEGAIRTTATVLGVIFGPALLRAAVLGGIAGAKLAASGIAAGAGWVAGAAQAGVAWLVNGAKASVAAIIAGGKAALAGLTAGGGWITGAARATVAWVAHGIKSVATSSVTAIRMAAHGVAVGAAWVASSTLATLQWTLSFGKLLITSSYAAIKMALHAADVGWAWALNGVRAAAVWLTQLPRIIAAGAVVATKSVIHATATSATWIKNAALTSAAWVTTELPKIAWAFLTTSGSAIAHAAIASGAWIKNAALASFAWVTTELPKIVLGFFATSGAASTHALASSAAWIASAARTAVAWVVTELPRIIASFALTSAAAVTQSAVASGAWVAAATTSSLSFKAFAALVATPLAMPAIAVAAALGAIAMVKQAWEDTMKQFDKTDQAIKQEMDTSVNLMNVAKKQYAAGKISKARFQELIKIAARATGTNNDPGGYRLVGEHGPERVYIPPGSQVTPAYRTRQEQQPSGRSGPTVVIQNYNSYNERDDRKFFDDLGFALENWG